MQKVYLVLSLGELKKIVEQVEQSSELFYGFKNENHTATLYSETVDDQMHEESTQISSGKMVVHTLLGYKSVYAT